MNINIIINYFDFNVNKFYIKIKINLKMNYLFLVKIYKKFKSFNNIFNHNLKLIVLFIYIKIFSFKNI